MEKFENACDVGEFNDVVNMDKAIQSTIKQRNKDGWKLLNTNVHFVGEIFNTRFFLFWEREVNS